MTFPRFLNTLRRADKRSYQRAVAVLVTVGLAAAALIPWVVVSAVRLLTCSVGTVRWQLDRRLQRQIMEHEEAAADGSGTIERPTTA